MASKFYYTLLLFLICDLALTKSFAQSNLKFNQVLSYSGTVGQGGTGPTWTVPSGKVWKVEYFTYPYFCLNNEKAGNGSSNGGPLWLKSGDQIKYDLYLYGANCCGAITDYLISIMEFDITQ
jgi:hypothetical protein